MIYISSNVLVFFLLQAWHFGMNAVWSLSCITLKFELCPNFNSDNSRNVKFAQWQLHPDFLKCNGGSRQIFQAVEASGEILNP